MKTKGAVIAQDETYHERPCLVAIEPVSGYILLESYADNRQADTWTAAMEKALGNKPLTVVQSTSDEGRGICGHIKSNGRKSQVWQKRAQQANQSISRLYHLYTLETGSAQNAEEVAAALAHQFDELETVAQEAGLSVRCQQRLAWLMNIH